MSNKVDFWLNPHETSGCYGNAKNDGHIIDKLKFPQRMTEHLLKVSALKTKPSFQNFDNIYLSCFWKEITRFTNLI